MAINKVFITILAILFVKMASAQYATLHFGIVYPTGDFANTNINTPEHGFASLGNSFGVSINYLVAKKWGITANYFNNSYDIALDEINRQLTLQQALNTTVFASYNNGYRATMAMIGPYLTLGNNKLTVDVKMYAGFANLRTPQFLYTTVMNGNTFTEVKNRNRASAPLFGYGITAKYALPKSFVVSLSLDNCRSAFNLPSTNYSSSNQTSINIPFQSFTLSAGIGYRIQ
jgi:hypothetical protein